MNKVNALWQDEQERIGSFRFAASNACTRMEWEIGRIEEYLSMCPEAAGMDVRHQLESLQRRIEFVWSRLPGGATHDTKEAAE